MLKARDFRRAAWDKLGGNWDMAVVISLLYGLIVGVASTFVIGFLIGGALTLGYTIFALHVSRGEKPQITDLFEGLNSFVTSLVLYIVNGLLIILWSLLLFIPGIIKSYAYSMSYYILRDDPDISASEARARSIELMRGNKWRLFCLDFSFIGWNILCILTFGILEFWVMPYHEVARAEFYNTISGKSIAVDVTAEEVDPNRVKDEK